MRQTSPSLGRAARGVVAVLPRASPARPPVAQVRIMVAGVDKDTRGAVEASVRSALGPQAETGPWSISVVSMAGKWSVTLDGPDERLRGRSFVAEGPRLADAIREAVRGAGEGPSNGRTTSPAPILSPSETRERHACEHCGKAVLVVYEEQPGETKTLAAVACPHCWKIGYVEVGAWAAAGGDYRAEKG